MNRAKPLKRHGSALKMPPPLHTNKKYFTPNMIMVNEIVISCYGSYPFLPAWKHVLALENTIKISKSVFFMKR